MGYRIPFSVGDNPDFRGLDEEENHLLHPVTRWVNHGSGIPGALFLVELGTLAQGPSGNIISLVIHDRPILQIGFLVPKNPKRIMHTLRRIFGRANLGDRDVAILRGIFRQLEWYATHGRQKKGDS